MSPALGSKVGRGLAPADLPATLVYIVFAHAVPATWRALPHFSMWCVLICILVSTLEIS